MSHIVVKPHHAGFGPYHRDPRTGEPWTAVTAADYKRRCEGSSRSGGIGCDVTECDCGEGRECPRCHEPMTTNGDSFPYCPRCIA